jgi:hypothetical protein
MKVFADGPRSVAEALEQPQRNPAPAAVRVAQRLRL